MPPRRRVRATASPSPAPQSSRASTPAERGRVARTAVPTKYSTSYGSPITQLPDRSTAGGGSITKAAAEIFTKVKRDNVAAEVRRRNRDQARAARAGSENTTVSPPPQITAPTAEVADLGSEEEKQSSGGEGSEYEDREETQPRRRSPRKSQKRARDDEAEAHAERERKERDARLTRERSAEARKVRSQKLAEAQAAREKAEQERKAEEDRRAQQAAEEEAARAAMPPPPQPLISRPAHDLTLTPSSAGMSMDFRPGSARSFIEEGKLFQEANVQTPPPPPLQSLRHPSSSVPAPPPQPAQAPAGNTRSPASLPPEPVSPPSVLKRPPRRPGGTTPAPRAGRASGVNQDKGTVPPTSPEEDASPKLDKKNQQQHNNPPDPFTAASYAHRLRNRFAPQANKAKANPADGQTGSLPASTTYDYLPRFTNFKNSFRLLSVLKVIAGAFVVLHLIRLAHTHIRPDLFEPTITWHGWNDWTNNLGQFFPSPLLHPLGVLTDDQYDDLKDYLHRRTTMTEAAVDNLSSILPKVVSVRKDKKGNLLIADEFWAALKDKIEHDSRILSLDGQSRISDIHWKAIEQRLKDAGLLGKPLSAKDVEQIVDQSAPASWEKWLAKNKQKIADIVGHGAGSPNGAPNSSPRGTTEAVISKDEFMRELTDRLAKSKQEVETEMGGIRKNLDGVLREVKKLASEGGMTRADTTKLIYNIIDKEITNRLARIGSKQGAAKIDAAFSNRVNLFSPGNNAQVDVSLSSPTYEIVPPPVGSKKYLKSMPRQPQFLPDKSQALRPWTDSGHCWCAATLGARNRTHPATLAVRLAQFVIPQYVLLEHIDPAATTDPLAMPRDVEIWAMFDEHTRRERVLDWMAAQFPADVKAGGAHNNNEKLIGDGWAKIGHFVYEHRPQDEGLYVHSLSRDLVDVLGAATDLVMLRAVTNYGSKDHTCFYRVRLYGDIVEEELQAERESRSW